MLATYVRGGSLTHVREPPVPYWTTQRLQAYRVPTPRSSAWRPPATQAFTTPSDMRLRFALRTVGMAMGPPLARGCHLCQQRCWRSRCPRAPRVRRRRPVPRCGAVRGDATVFVVALQARRQPASQPARLPPDSLQLRPTSVKFAPSLVWDPAKWRDHGQPASREPRPSDRSSRLPRVRASHSTHLTPGPLACSFVRRFRLLVRSHLRVVSPGLVRALDAINLRYGNCVRGRFCKFPDYKFCNRQPAGGTSTKEEHSEEHASPTLDVAPRVIQSWP